MNKPVDLYRLFQEVKFQLNKLSRRVKRLEDATGVTGTGTALTVEELDGTPTIPNVTTIRTSGITVSSPSTGIALLTATGGSGAFPTFVGGSAGAVIGNTTTTSTLRLEWTTTGGGGRMAYDPYGCFATYTISGQPLTIFEVPQDGVYFIDMQVDIGVTWEWETGGLRWWYPRLELYSSAWPGALGQGGAEIPSSITETSADDVIHKTGNYIPIRVQAIAPLVTDDQVYGHALGTGSPALTGADLEMFTGWGSFTVFKIGEIV